MADGFVLSSERDAKDLVSMLRLFRSGAFGGLGGIAGGFQVTPRTPYYVTNDSGEEVPAYACMQVVGTEEIGGQNFLSVDIPADVSGDAGAFLFNGSAAIADGDQGVAQFGPVVRAFKDTGTVTAGDRWQPVVGQWYIEADTEGEFIAAGADDIEDDVLRIFTGVGGGGTGTNCKLVKCTAGIAAATATLPGKATCSIVQIASDLYAAATGTLTVYNTSEVAIPVDKILPAWRETVSGLWVAQPGIVGLQYSDPNLQYRVDGLTWVTWATTTEC